MISLVFFVLAIVGFFLYLCLLHKRQSVAFEQKFPPISDEDYLARCRPGVNPGVALRVRRVIADCLGVEYSRVYPSSRLMEDLGAE